MLRVLAAVVVLVLAGVATAEDLRRAQELAWARRFAEAEVLYRQILAADPASRAAQFELARVVMWQGRYAEAIDLFEAIRPQDADTVEGRGTARYWSGDLRGAARDFRQALSLDLGRELARRSLAEIAAVTRSTQELRLASSQDDQPLDTIRAGLTATFFSDPQTRWTITLSGYQLDAGRLAQTADGQSLVLGNETSFRGLTAGATLGLFTYPDGARRPIGSASVRRGAWSLRVERQPELASATALSTHASSTITTLRWDHDRVWIGAAEVSDRRYSDGNSGHAAVAYAVFPLRRKDWVFWLGGSAAARDTERSRFGITAVSSTLEGTLFRYQYRGEYDPYWTPDDLLEARAVVAVERRFARVGLKLHGDAGYARDRGRGFGPDTGATPFPSQPFTFAFDRDYVPWRTGLLVDVQLSRDLRLETGIERSVTVDYSATSFHAALVRRR
jgi:hypothetical protein